MGKNDRQAKHRRAEASNDEPRDNWFVSFVAQAHKWDRKPGDKLTRQQRRHVAGGVVVYVILIGFVVFLFVCMYFIAVEMGRPDYGRP